MMKSLTEHQTAAGTAYLDCGNGEPLVLIHGVGLNKQVWQPQLDAFCGEYRVIAYDTLGHGNSWVPTAHLALNDYFEQLIELLDTLEIPSVNLCGHSMGALITDGGAAVMTSVVLVAMWYLKVTGFTPSEPNGMFPGGDVF